MDMRKEQEIKVIEYVHTAEGGVCRVDELGPEQYEAFRQWLGCSWMNEIFRGRAAFGYEGGCHG